MELHKVPPLSFTSAAAAVVLIAALAYYSLRSADVVEVDVEEATVSVCQIRVHVETTYSFDDRTLVALLAKLKAYDFQIGQPVWGSADTLLYLCEHRLRGGMKQTTVDRELNNVIKNGPYSSGRLVWSCA